MSLQIHHHGGCSLPVGIWASKQRHLRFSMNPIWKREFFARWRDGRSHLLLLGLALLVSLAAYWSYQNAISYEPRTYQMSMGVGLPARTYTIDPATGGYVLYLPESLATRASRTGHALFTFLSMGNVAVWFVLAPLLTATGVARERERGLLESLQLSRMSPRSQIVARAMSAMLYLAALQLVTLPIYFVAFSFGGVSPGEIGRVWLVVAGAAWCGVGLGLALSSGAHRPSGALFGALALLFMWTLVAFLGFQGAQSPYGFLGLASGTSAAPLTFCQTLFYSHPFAMMSDLLGVTTLQPPSLTGPNVSTLMLLANGKRAMGTAPTIFTPVFWKPFQVLPFALLAWLVLGTLGLLKATRDVTRAFAPAGWAGRNPLVEKWKKRRTQRLEAQRAKASARVEGALLADLPFDRLIRFKNPLLSREVKGRFRLRRASAPLWFARSMAFLFAVVGWVMAMTTLFDPVARASGASVVLWMEWILGVALVGTFAASGFAREREAGTWEGVRLSLLSNGEIARTKWASPLIAFALLTLPLWLLLWAFVPVGGWNGVPFRVLLAGALVVATSLGFVSALANWVSLRARNTTTATCWTLGVLLALFWVLPAAWASFDVSRNFAASVVGVRPDARNSRYYGSTAQNNFDYVDLYRQETGITLQGEDPQAFNRSFNASPEQVEAYSRWLEAKQKQATFVVALADAWNSMLVLNEFGDSRKAQDAPSVRDNDLVIVALLHGLFCAGAITLLLWSVTRRLKLRLE